MSPLPHLKSCVCIYLTVQGLCCCRWAFSSVVSGGFSSLWLIASSCSFSCRGSTGSRAHGLGAVARRLSYPWHVGSSWARDRIHAPALVPLDHQGSPHSHLELRVSHHSHPNCLSEKRRVIVSSEGINVGTK